MVAQKLFRAVLGMGKHSGTALTNEELCGLGAILARLMLSPLHGLPWLFDAAQASFKRCLRARKLHFLRNFVLSIVKASKAISRRRTIVISHVKSGVGNWKQTKQQSYAEECRSGGAAVLPERRRANWPMVTRLSITCVVRRIGNLLYRVWQHLILPANETKIAAIGVVAAECHSNGFGWLLTILRCCVPARLLTKLDIEISLTLSSMCNATKKAIS